MHLWKTGKVITQLYPIYNTCIRHHIAIKWDKERKIIMHENLSHFKCSVTLSYTSKYKDFLYKPCNIMSVEDKRASVYQTLNIVIYMYTILSIYVEKARFWAG